MAGPEKIGGYLPPFEGPHSTDSTSPPQTDRKGVSKNKVQGDSVEFSLENKEYQHILEAIRNLPEIRQDRIDQIRQTLESGIYTVDTPQLTDRLIRETLLNSSSAQESSSSTDASLSS